MVGIRVAGYSERLYLVLDNKAVVDKFNRRRTAQGDNDARSIEAKAPGQHVPCLDDLADSDLWAAIGNEHARWGHRVQVHWCRSHPEKRMHKSL